MFANSFVKGEMSFAFEPANQTIFRLMEIFDKCSLLFLLNNDYST